jgi:hypothetical protein
MNNIGNKHFDSSIAQHKKAFRTKIEINKLIFVLRILIFEHWEILSFNL